MSLPYTSDSARSESAESADSASRDSLDDLPFAQPLARADFLSPTFTPSSYLSTLSRRHQTLEDLRSELRSRSQQLSAELLDLVNANYADFLTLGRSLRGGDEKVERVQVALLAFAKDVALLERMVRAREDEVGELLQQRRDARREIELGRRLVEFEERMRECEEGVAVARHGGGGDSSDSSGDSDDSESESESEEGVSPRYGAGVARLRRNVVLYRLVKEGIQGLEQHPFVAAQTLRLGKLRSTLLLDLGSALRQARSAGAAASGALMQIMDMYAAMEEQGEAVKVLKTLKST
ncbi:uncharacterized protein M421DRAFT_158755 [Didymella exigua CBS 183.55]|uniref:Conserved oligomeric Golgi complex subunit 2 n=1 Tax=Didymella exigua CBS 183.55 TaxID=1150837 RepID=A0A6A5RLI9_9PLEO|nr:uncharacterized protein M421DRAFT_158755 [Didymella exigua CBS 183.55]KAF1928323.1 hypothetical protein M421DRAFT_158755 [Didymella exigua CBS 183.55]